MSSSNNNISMDCKKCGGELKISPNADILQCMYCGTQYLVKREFGGVFLNSYAACPLCKKNDKVVKLSSQTHRNTPEHNFSPPPEPQYAASEPGGCLQTIGIYSLVSAALLLFITLALGPSEADTVGPMIMLLVIGVALLGFTAYKRNVYTAKKNEYLAPLLARWEQDNEKWKKLYYCERDDIVFVVDTKKYWPAEEYSRKHMELNNH